MPRTAGFLATISILSVLTIAAFPAPSFAQQTPGAKRDGAQSRRKLGEMITRADRGQRWSDQLEVGTPAPEFTLPLLARGGKGAPSQMISLRELCAERPAVLIFGSITCPPFRGQLDGVNQVYQQLSERAEAEWRGESEAARRQAKVRGIHQAAIDEAVRNLRYGT